MGYTPDLTVGVWMGNADNSQMAPGTYSSVGSGPIWRRFMEEAHTYLELPPKQFQAPNDVLLLSCGGRSEVFKKGAPAVKAGGCRGPDGSGGTATPTPGGPVFPTTQHTPTPTPGAPAVLFYTVREGDTLEFIAELFAVALEDLLAANSLNEGDDIFPGDVLIIPGQTEASPDPDPDPDAGPDFAPQGIVVPVPSGRR